MLKDIFQLCCRKLQVAQPAGFKAEKRRRPVMRKGISRGQNYAARQATSTSASLIKNRAEVDSVRTVRQSREKVMLSARVLSRATQILRQVA